MAYSIFSMKADYNLNVGNLPPEHRPDPVYDTLFPYYVELCALSQFRGKDHVIGGVPGHSVMYLHGACRDPKSDYPQLCICEDSDAANDGVGVTVNRYTKNANWLAIPGRKLFYDGNLGPDDRVTEQAVEAVAQQAIDLGVYNGVELLDEVKDKSLIDFAREESVGTDFALTFARSIFCARVPVTKAMMQEMILFLNALNNQYRSGPKAYHWDGLHDNCAHVTHNALAAASIWPPTKVGGRMFRHSLAIPANEYINLVLRCAEFPLDNFDAILQDEDAHDSLLEFGWLPARHGALIKTRDIRQANDVYDTDFHLFLLEPPDSKKTKQTEKYLYDPHCFDLEPNLRLYQARYQKILDHKPTDESEFLRGGRDWSVFQRYYRYIAAQLEDVTAKLATFG
ncbi:MAG: hypothetical protein KDJ97_30555 [Anaerolineae bacterium]|nr:hypothetical protein [Anaerolineae bacterium]